MPIHPFFRKTASHRLSSGGDPFSFGPLLQSFLRVAKRSPSMSLPGSRSPIFLSLAILALLTLPSPAYAQCGLLTQDFLNISLETGSAFVADYFTNTRSPILGVNGSPINAGLKSVARDSEGRVRIVRSAGKYIVKETDGVATEVERLSII